MPDFDVSLDLGGIGRDDSTSTLPLSDDVIQRERQKESLRQQRNLAALEGSRAGALGELAGFAEPAVEAAAYFPWDVINLPSTVTGGFPIVPRGQPVVQIPATTEDIRQAIVQNPVLAGSILGANPDLSAGVVRGALDVGESFTTPPNLMMLGALPKAPAAVQRPVTAAFAGQMGLDVPEQAARLGEATVTGTPAEQFRQATALAANVALPTSMALHPEVASRRAAYDEAVRLEGTRLDDYFRQRRLAEEYARQQGIPVEAGQKPTAPAPASATLPVPDILNQSPEGIPFGEPFTTFRTAQLKAARDWVQQLEPGVYEGIDEDGGVAFKNIEVNRRRNGTIEVLAVGENGIADLTDGGEFAQGQATKPDGTRFWFRGIRLRKKGVPSAVHETPPVAFPERLKSAAESGQIAPGWGAASGSRPVIFVKIGDGWLPFYRSSMGTGGAKTAGEWQPFFGFGNDAWLIKGSNEDIASDYGDPRITQARQWLNENFNWPHEMDLDLTFNPQRSPLNALGPMRNINPELQRLFGEFQFDNLRHDTPEQNATHIQSILSKLKGGPNAIYQTPEGAVRTVQQPSGTTESAGTLPAAVSSAQAGPRSGGIAGEAAGAEAQAAPSKAGALNIVFPRQAGIQAAKEGDIVELYGHIGELGTDEQGRTVIKTDTGLVEVPKEGIPNVRLAVTPEGKIVLPDGLFEPSVGAGKPWRNAFNPENGWLRVRKVGDGIRHVLTRPTSDWIAAKLDALEPPRPRSKSLRVPGLPAEATETGLAESETQKVDTPVDEYLLNAGIKQEAADKVAAAEREKAERAAAMVTLRNNVAQPLPEFQVEAMDRDAPNPHTGRFFPANVTYNPSGLASAYLDVRGPARFHSYRVPLSELPAGSWTKTDAGIQFDKRAVIAFLDDDVRRFTNRNLNRNARHFAPQDIDAIAGVTRIGRPQKRPGVPLRVNPETGAPLPGTGTISKDIPTSSRETLESALEVKTPFEENLNQPIVGIVRRVIDRLRANNLPVFKELEGTAYKDLDDAFWGRVKTAVMQDPEVAALRPEQIEPAANTMVEHLKALKESGRFNRQAIIQGPSQAAITEATRIEDGRYIDSITADSLGEARAMIERAELKGWLPDETIDVLRDMLDSPVAGYLSNRNLKLSITYAIRGDFRMAGSYDPVRQLIEVVTRAKPGIAAHEFFHPIWDMIRDEDRLRVSEWRKEAIAKAMETATGKDLADLQKLSTSEIGYERFFEEGIGNKFYRLSSTEEYFAHMMSERWAQERQGIWGRSKEILASQDAFLAKIRQIIQVIMDAIRRNVPGLRTQADVLQKQILSGKYDVLPIEGGNVPGRRLVTKNAVITAPGVGPEAVITAHHGTPHQIEERFLTERIGTGQGAATYGWGLYFGEHPGVAADYARTLAGKFMPSEEQLRQYFKPGNIVPSYGGGRDKVLAFDWVGGDWRVIVKALKKSPDGTWVEDRDAQPRTHYTPPSSASLAAAGIRTGSEYTVRLDVNKEDLLDWDLPLNQQSPKVQAALPQIAEAVNRNAILLDPNAPMGSGRDLYEALARGLAEPYQEMIGRRKIGTLRRIPDPKAASEYLNSIGIPGIKYLDQGSRGSPLKVIPVQGRPEFAVVESAGDERLIQRGFASRQEAQAFADAQRTYNFVIFDDKLIHITHENGQEVPFKEAMGTPREPQAALESPEKVEEYVRPLELRTTPTKFHDMAAVLNKSMVPPPAAERFAALPEGVRGELADVFPGRIETYRERPNAPSFREVMRNEAIPPEERSDYARHAFEELGKYQADKRAVLGQLATVTRDLTAATIKAIEMIPKTNEAELLATNLIGGVLDRIKAERERTAEGAQANAHIQGGIQHIEALNDLLRQPVPLANAMRGIATLVGRAALNAARPGGDILELIGQRAGFEGGVFEHGSNQWVHALAAHLARLEIPDGNRRAINASQEIIESTLHALVQLGDAREALHEFQLADDGTLRRFRADYLADLQSQVPRGFNTILRRYASAQVEADALTSASRRLDRRIDALTTRKANLESARDFLAEHDRDPAFMDYGKAVVQYTGAETIEFTRDGTKVTYPNPLTGKLVTIDESFKEGGSLENIRKARDLAQDGLTYAAQPGADPFIAAGWTSFAENIDNYLLAASPHYDVLTDPAWNVLKRINNLSQLMIAETQLSRIPGFGAARAERALRAMSPAMKAKNAFQKDAENMLIAPNIDAWKSHPDIGSLQQWQDEVAMPIIDKRQHYGQNVYRVGDTISGYNHVVTAEDLKAVKGQTSYDHNLVGLHQRAFSAAIAEAPQKIKIGESTRRFALMRGPGTVTRLIPQSTRDLPAQWFDAITRRPEERREGETDADAGAAAAAERLNTFLGTGRNFFKIVMGHVIEDERDYFQLGKGPMAGDYKALREDERDLARAGRLPNNMDDLTAWLAAHHNEHLRQEPPEPPITPNDVRLQLITEISNYMRKGQEDQKESANRAKVDITSYENSFTQPREVKIFPGTLYEYGIADRFKANRMGNDAVEYYVVRWRDSLQELYDDLLRQKTNITKTLRELYGGESRRSSKQLHKAIQAGEHEDRLGRYQLTAEEVDRNIDRVGKLLQNSKDLLKRRGEFYGDDIANRLFSPTTSFFAGSLLLSPSSWILNGSSGSVMGALKIAEINRGGWLIAPFSVIKAHLRTIYKTILSQPPKDERARIIHQLAKDPVLQDGVIDWINDTNREFTERQLMRRSGVVDSFSYRDNLGLDRDLPLARNLRNAIETIRSVSAKPDPNLTKQVLSYLGVIPKAWTILTRSIGMRWADNWINLNSTTLANSIAEPLRLRATKVFDNRLANDPRFAELYRQYGDSFQRFSIALAGEGEGGFLTPAEITGRLGPTARKAAVQLRRMFLGNNDPIDKIMLRYWWNQRSANGDRNAPFMTTAQRSALQYAIAGDINMGDLATRSQWFQGSRLRQMLGVLGQYWIWNTDKLSDIVAGVRGQKSYGRYLPQAMAFLIAAGLVGLVSGQVSQQVTQKLYNTISSTPAFWEATDDPQKLKIVVSNMANYLGMIGSAAKYAMDTPGKLGYRNPILLQNIITDALDVIAKTYQTHDALNPILDFAARYLPPLRIALNRSDMREGLMDIRNAANALRAASPDSIEAKRRQPTPGSDLRGTPMTPIYNSILNSAAVGDWASADESFAKAVEQARAAGNPNPEQSIVSAIRTRSPESSAYSRTLTDDERDMVYSRLSPENRAAVDKANQVFTDIASRYGTGGGGGVVGGTRQAGLAPRFGAAAGLSARAGLGGSIGGGGGRLSLGAPRGVRAGFRNRSLARGLRARSLLGGVGARIRRPRVGGRLRRLAI